ncbi:cytokine receptor family member B12 isoform X1 [Lepisosteus oculatus]|uniref:cytokine receptor family member B12 isoform X1 n=1 Tax=Lepisosteus oculatus TaxID=7918 RepID=UPI0035F5225A
MRRFFPTAAVFLCLLCCNVTPSAGGLSPPVNLNVAIVDFVSQVQWTPGLGARPGTLYSLQMKNTLLGLNQTWEQVENCTAIESTSCRLPLSFADIYGYFFIRVRATWNGRDSDWSQTKQFQPYRDSDMSPPITSLSFSEQSISVRVHHHIAPLWRSLQYVIEMYETRKPKTVQLEYLSNVSGQAMHCFEGLIPQYRYCVRAKVIAHTESPLSPEKCISLPSKSAVHNWKMVSAVSCALLLLAFLAVTSILLLLCYLRPKPSACQTPRTLMIFSEDPCWRQNLKNVVWNPKGTLVSSPAVSAWHCSTALGKWESQDDQFPSDALVSSEVPDSPTSLHVYCKRCSLFLAQGEEEPSPTEKLEPQEPPTSGHDTDEQELGPSYKQEFGTDVAGQPFDKILEDSGGFSELPSSNLPLDHGPAEGVRPKFSEIYYKTAGDWDTSASGVMYGDPQLYISVLGLCQEASEEPVCAPALVESEAYEQTLLGTANRVLPTGYEWRPDPCAL